MNTAKFMHQLRLAPGFRMLLLSAATVVGGCASKLERDLTDNAPGGGGLELKLDMSLIDVTDLRDGRQVNLGAYMDAEGRDHLLLAFGSRTCTACNKEARHLVNEVIGLHPLFLTEAGRRFEIVGVNTDTEGYNRYAGYFDQLPFIRWNDPSGRMMLRHFMPPGNKFRVPLTVLVRRDGIVWRVMPDEPVSVAELMRRVETSLGLDATGSGDDGDDGGDDDGDDDDKPDNPVVNPPPVVAATDLAFVGPGRLKQVAVTRCEGAVTTLDEALGWAGVKFVQVVKGACGADCAANLAQLESVQTGACAAQTDGMRRCAAVSLQGEGAGQDGPGCGSGVTVTGQDAARFFELFATHFDWAYPRIVDGGGVTRLARAVEGPLVLAFGADGRLVYSREGRLPEGELATLVAAPDFNAGRATGPDFPVYEPATGTRGFSALWQRSKLTVLIADTLFTPFPCGPCEQELQHWSQPGGLLEFCQARPAQCQLALLETRSLPAGDDLAGFHAKVLNGGPDPDDPESRIDGILQRGIKVPLILDPLPGDGPAGNEYLSRYWDGYMLAKTPEMDYGGRIFIYNEDGRVVARFASGEGAGERDPIAEFVKAAVAGQ